MDNTVGSTNSNFCNFRNNQHHAYFLGLWCADGYHRTSSIGLSNINEELILKFSNFLTELLNKDRLRLRVYHHNKIELNSSLPVSIEKISHLMSRKSKHTAYHIYVNCRRLLREFKKAKEETKEFENESIGWAYLAGRFDGDGSVDKNLRNDLRIVYSTFDDASKDYELIKFLGIKNVKIYRYRTSSTYCIYVYRIDSKLFLEKIYSYSSKLQKLEFVSRRDLAQVAL